MHLFGLNWHLQQTENDTFENGKVNADLMPTHTVSLPSGDNGKRKNHGACALNVIFHKRGCDHAGFLLMWERRMAWSCYASSPHEHFFVNLLEKLNIHAFITGIVYLSALGGGAGNLGRSPAFYCYKHAFCFGQAAGVQFRTSPLVALWVYWVFLIGLVPGVGIPY